MNEDCSLSMRNTSLMPYIITSNAEERRMKAPNMYGHLNVLHESAEIAYSMPEAKASVQMNSSSRSHPRRSQQWCERCLAINKKSKQHTQRPRGEIQHQHVISLIHFSWCWAFKRFERASSVALLSRRRISHAPNTIFWRTHARFKHIFTIVASQIFDKAHTEWW